MYSRTDRREVQKGRDPKPKRRIMRLLFAPTKLFVRRAKRHQSGSDSQSSNIVRCHGTVTGGKAQQNISKSAKRQEIAA